jgi:mediator of DNA damage checkpoint protein 1
MAGGGDEDTEVLDGGTAPPLGECGLFNDSILHLSLSLELIKGALGLVAGCVFSLGSPVSDDGESDDGALYCKTQPLEDADTQLVDEEDGVAADWMETQLVESGEEDGGDYGGQVETQLETEHDDDDEEDAGDAEDNACNGIMTQLVAECEVDGGNSGVGDMVDTQLVEESDEEAEDGVNGGDEVDVGEWGKTQLVEDSDEELRDDGELSEGTQVLTDNESLLDYEQDVASRLDGGVEEMNGNAERHLDDKNVVDSDASTDEEGDAG